MRDVVRGRPGSSSSTAAPGAGKVGVVGKRTLVDVSAGELRLKASGPGKLTGDAAQSVAEAAMSGPAQSLPYRAAMEQQFGVPLDHVAAYTGPAVQAAGQSLGASAFARGDRVAFAEPNPSRSTVAHEVAHVLQQTRGGGAGSEAHDEAEAHAAESGAALAFRGSGIAGAAAVRRQPAPQPAQDTPVLSAPAARQAIAFNKGRKLPADAWAKIAAVVGIDTTAIDEAMVRAIATCQQGQKLDVDGSVGDITLQWMSSSPGGAGLDAQIKNEPVAYMGINPTSRDTELSTLKSTGATVSGATGRKQQDTAMVGGKVADLTTDDGREAFVAQFDRLDAAARASAKSFLETASGGSRDELAQFLVIFYEAEIGKRIIKRVVLSGHSAGYSVGGEGNNDTSVSFYSLKVLNTLFPRAAGQVEDLMLSACNTGQISKLAQYTAIFPNLRSIWGYVGYSPLGSSAGSGANRHIAKWQAASRGGMDHDKLDAARKDVAKGTGTDKNVALWTRDNAAATPEYTTASPEAAEDFATLKSSVDGGLGTYHEAYDNGNINGSELTTLYTRLQTLTGNHQGELGSDYDKYMLITNHVLYLRFWSSITTHFWQANGAEVTKAYEGHGKMPNFRAGPRSDVLQAIQSFPGDKSSEAYRLLTKILRDLDPTLIPNNWF